MQRRDFGQGGGCEGASKEVEFSVQKATDGKLSVSVTPFQF
jgi:hypothetical protein